MGLLLQALEKGSKALTEKIPSLASSTLKEGSSGRAVADEFLQNLYEGKDYKKYFGDSLVDYNFDPLTSKGLKVPEKKTSYTLPLGGGMLIGALLGAPDEAEASPLGKLQPITKAFSKVKKLPSSAEDRLIGVTLKIQGEDKQITKVLKPKSSSNQRWLVFSDGTQLPMTKDYVEALSGAKGTDLYMKKFKMQYPKGQNIQTDVALERMRSLRGGESLKDFKKWNQSQIEKISEVDPSLLKDFRYVKDLETGETYYTNHLYAENLEKRKKVKIVGSPKLTQTGSFVVGQEE